MALPLDTEEQVTFLERLEPVTVISEEDFNSALAFAADPPHGARVDLPSAVGEHVQQRAARIAGAANDPASLGGIAQISPGPTSFAGNLFLVVRDPVFDPDARRVQFTEFMVAAVRLTGTVSWVGHGVVLALNTKIIGEPGRCCGPATICVPEEGPAPEPGWTPLAGTSGVGSSETVPFAAVQRSKLGRPTIPLHLFGKAPTGGHALVPSLHTCTRVLSDPGCAVAMPVCDWHDVGFTSDAGGGGEGSAGSTLCLPGSGGTVPGRDVPTICQYIRSEENLPAECGGWCEHCGTRYHVYTGLDGYCQAALPVPGGGSPCDPQTAAEQAMRNDRLKLEFGWTGPGDTGTRCTPSGRGGVELCITCDAQNPPVCSSFAKRPPYDPALAEGTGTDEIDSTEDDDSGEGAAVTVTVSDGVTTISGVVIVNTGSGGPAPSSPVLLGGIPSPPTAPPDRKSPPQGEGPSGPTTPGAPSTQPPSTAGDGWTHQFEPSDFGNGTSKKPTGGDPVDLGSGALRLVHTDLSFPGPVRPLELVRSYSSRSRQRSGLGSNWTHSWDVWLRPLDADSVPEFLSPWCAGGPDEPTTVLLHDGLAGVELFVLDIATHLFLPQAGGSSTLRRTTDGGWALRDPEGRVRVFNADGYLVQDRDRFGVGFSVMYEPTPLWALFQYWCTPAQLAARGEDLTSRRNWLLAWLIGAVQRPDTPSVGWEVRTDDFPVPSDVDNDTATALHYAAAYLTHLSSSASASGLAPESADGHRRLRPVTVIDDLARRLTFEYVTAPDDGHGTFDFAARPDTGLLQGVAGPAGTRVRYRYDRPYAYPAELNEMFLTRASREDGPSQDAAIQPTPARTFEFEYAWPTTLGPLGRPSYDWYRNRVEASYLEYFRTFTGCWLRDNDLCRDGSRALHPPRLAPGNPVTLARRAANDYVSDVADNVVTVTDTGRLECESRYQIDPWLQDWDRVMAQRFGSNSTVDTGPYRADQAPRFASSRGPQLGWEQWRTNLPMVEFGYVEAGPAPDGGDRTDAFLPRTLRERFPLEDEPAPPRPAAAPRPIVPADTKLGNYCRLGDTADLRSVLPGWSLRTPYYDPPIDQRHPLPNQPLRRTRLAPEQLTDSQVSDPAHNDLTSSYAKDPTGSLVIKRLIGGRARTAWNANRICAWAYVRDRDGDVTYTGMNYRGDTLVTAVADDAGYVVTERLVNADGRPVQERRPTRTPTRWTVAAGYTRYTYDEIDQTGERGWNSWLPVLWARRGNLLRLDERAAEPGVVDDDEASGTFGTSLGRYQRYAYEPLFNQLAVSVEGAVVRRWRADGSHVDVDVPHRTHRRIFDYQELSLTAAADDPSSIRPVLAELEPWGFHWGRDAAGDYDLAVVGWQLPLELFGVDLDADGVLGNRFATRPCQRAVGVPVLTLDFGDDPTDVQVSVLRWSPHGLPIFIQGPDGEQETRTYHPLSAPFGGGVGAVPDGGKRGMLATISRSRFLTAYPSSWGQAGQHPCAGLKGPYQWLIPASTPDAQVPEALRALGLPAETVADILATSDPRDPDARVSIDFTWTPTGHRRRVRTQNGDELFTTDGDGRNCATQDRCGTRTEVEHDAWGDPTRLRRFAADGSPIFEVRWTFDGAHHPLTEAVALDAGAFTNPAAGQLVTRSWTWTGEEQPATITDTAGLVTAYRYDSHKRRTGVVSTQPGIGSRGTAWRYDDDGLVTETRHGALVDDDPGLVVEKTVYDGLGRMKRTVDGRGVTWQHAWSWRDLPTRTRCSDIPYGAAVPAPTSYETTASYDTHGRPVSRRINGLEVQRSAYSRGGRLLRQSGAGRGVTELVPDADGSPAWQRAPDGTITVQTIRPARHSVAVVRPQAPPVATTAVITNLDASGVPLLQVLTAGGLSITRSWDLDANQRPIRYIDHLGHAVGVRRNWAGWVTEITKPREGRGGGDVTVLDYDLRGWPLTVTDPAGDITTYERDPWGLLTMKTAGGQPAVVEQFGYDAIGRPETIARGTDSRRLIRDTAGDVIRVEVDGTAGPEPLITASFDELGRITQAQHTNRGLTSVAAANRLVTCGYAYDDLGRIAREEITVGSSGGPTSTQDARWQLRGDRWSREVTVTTAGTVRRWIEGYDEAERLAQSVLLVQGRRPSRQVDFIWIGDLYSGRTHQQSPVQSPLREHRDLDPFGQAERVRWSVVDVDPSGLPVDTTEGAQYCAGPWDPAVCAVPLLDVRYSRDPVGRVGVTELRWGNPRTDSSGLITDPQDARWRGFAYTSRGHLGAIFERDLATPPPPPAAYAATAPAVLGALPGAAPWNYRREPAVGSLSSITGNTERWKHIGPRGPGYELATVEVDQQTIQVSHDTAGRVTSAGAIGLQWHADDQLAAVLDVNGILERYAYTPDGRLAAVWGPGDSGASPAFTFTYDGPHIVGASSGGTLAWEARWGPGLDRLIEFTDHAGGGGTVLPLTDESRSVIGAWSPKTGLIGTVDYSPEGRVIARNADGAVTCNEPDGGALCRPPADIPFGFAGAWRSSATGLSWLRRRWLDPRLGQFLTRDPLGAVDGHNTYTYAAGDPINRRDPLGLSSQGPSAASPTQYAATPSVGGGGNPGGRTAPPFPPKAPPMPQIPQNRPVKVPDLRIPGPGKGPGAPNIWADRVTTIAEGLLALEALRTILDTTKAAQERLGRQSRQLDRGVPLQAPGSTPPTDSYREPPERRAPVVDPRQFPTVLEPIPGGPAAQAPSPNPSAPPRLAGRSWPAGRVEGMPALKTPHMGVGAPGTNAAGKLRLREDYWKMFMEVYPEAISIGNGIMIEAGLSPMVDAEFVAFEGNEWMEGFIGDFLDHHHWNKGAWAIGLPHAIHLYMSGAWH